MAFPVTIQEVTFSEGGNGPRKYKRADVVYTYKGNQRKQTVMSFKNPDVFKVLQGLKTPSEASVEVTKDGDFTTWSKITLGTSTNEAAPATTSMPTSGRVLGSNYETPEERAKRQLLIVRQSSLTNALTFLSTNSKKELEFDKVLSVAQEFVDFVYGTEKVLDSMDGIPEDIPH